MADRVTLQQVAQVAGVAPSTVSRVLRGNVRCASRRTARRIRRAAQELGYRPNFAARVLASGQSRLIGVAIGRHGWGVYTQQLRATSEELRRRGYEALPLEYDRPTAVISSFSSALTNRMLEGMIVCTDSEGLRADLEELISAEVPVVSLAPSSVEGVPVVTVDYETGSYMATRYLMSLGHTRVAIVNPYPDRTDPKDVGCRRALEERGLKPLWVSFSRPYERPAFNVGYEMGQELLQMQERPTAAMCSNDEVAIGVIRASHEHGLQVPRDLSVVGFDDLELGRYCVPALTTVRQPIDVWAARAVDRLFDLIEGQSPGPLQEIVPTELLVRESCGELPGKEVN